MVIPEPPKRISSSLHEVTPGTVLRYCLISSLSMPFPLPCRIFTWSMPTIRASSINRATMSRASTNLSPRISILGLKLSLFCEKSWLWILLIGFGCLLSTVLNSLFEIRSSCSCEILLVIFPTEIVTLFFPTCSTSPIRSFPFTFHRSDA